MTKCSCFVAYQSYPPSLAETIEQAIYKINDGSVVDIKSWKSTIIGGKFVINAICEAIRKSDLFICDLTYLNHNVLFELGYAIAQNKRVWLINDSGIESSKIDRNSFDILTTLGNMPYANSNDIVKAFYKEAPYDDLENTIYKNMIERVSHGQSNEYLLYLKAGILTEASIQLSRLINNSSIHSIVDDPNEVRIQTLSWYAERVWGSFAVIAHFLSADQSGSKLQNAKNAFVSGLAYGMGKNILMIAHEPYVSPIDYKDFLKTHDTAVTCVKLADEWLKHIEDAYKRQKSAKQEYQKELKVYSELQTISIGDAIAENEEENLANYFVPTAAYYDALNTKQTLFVGRKGSGKTAILIKLAADIRSDPRNHLCIIRPIGYEAIGIVDMVEQSLQRAEKGYLIESFWKFLIYTELAKSVYHALAAKPIHYQMDQAESELNKFVEINNSIIMQDFSIRLEYAVNRLQNIGGSQTAALQRAKISELLHDQIISKLRTILGDVLEKKHKVIVLIDNLDKAWDPKENLITLCDLLHGLIEVTQRITHDFSKSSLRAKPVNLSIITFLRSDIFVQVLNHTIERDKVPFSRISWNDPEMLIRVLEERFMISTNLSNPKDIWSTYFCPIVAGQKTKEYLIRNILPKPRDLIYLVKTALANAINRHHIIIDEDDIITAQKSYSQYALDTLDAENAVQLPSLLNLLYEFAGVNEIINQMDILSAMKKCNIPEVKLQEAIDLLCDLTFLGREIENDRFEFQQTEQDGIKQEIMASRLTDSKANKLQRLRINQPFHSFLEIKAMNL